MSKQSAARATAKTAQEGQREDDEEPSGVVVTPPPAEPKLPTSKFVVGFEDLESAEKAKKELLAQTPIEKRRYRVLSVTYGDPVSTEPWLPGTIVSGLDAKMAKSLLEQGALEEIIPSLNPALPG